MKLPVVLFMAAFYGSVSAQTTLPSNLVAANAVLQKEGTGYSFTEGSSVAADGKVYFTDQPNDRIYVWEEGTGVSLFMEGTERSNGTFFDRQGNLVVCADLRNRLILITPNRQIKPLMIQEYEGKHFNGPNDLWIHPSEFIYFTDPYYRRNYWPPEHKQELEKQAVYLTDEERDHAVMVIGDLEQPNGIVGTPDGKYLYVADIRAKKTWRYTINSDGSLTDQTLFAPVGSDGMTLDNRGNVYLTFGRVHVYNKKGEKTGEIELPESPSNLCFGGKNRDILFITARTSVYTLKMKVKGVE